MKVSNVLNIASQLNEAAPSKKMTPEKMADDILRNTPEVTFSQLYQKADDLYGTPEGEALDKAIGILSKRAETYRAKTAKLVAECDAIDRGLHDPVVAGENCGLSERMVNYEAEFYRHACAVIAQNAEELGIDINKALGYIIH